MPDASQLTPGAVEIPDAELHEATILDNAEALGQEVRCVVPTLDPQLATDPAAWRPLTTVVGEFWPKKGDRALVTRQVGGPPLIDWWEPGASTPDVPGGKNKIGPIVNVATDFGAKGDSSDETAILQAAISSMPATAGILFLPPGNYRYSHLDLEGRRSLVVMGAGALSAGAQPATRLVCDGTAQPGINLRSTYGISFVDVALAASGASVMTSLVDLGHGEAATDAAYATFDRVVFSGPGAALDTLVNLDKAIIISFKDCRWGNAVHAVRGKALQAGYSNAISFYSPTFMGLIGTPIVNPGEAWSFYGPCVEPLTNGTAAFIGQDAGFTAKQVAIFGGWFGDATQPANEGDWIQFSGVGLTTVGVKVGTGASWARLGTNAAVEGVLVAGCTFDTVAHLFVVKAGAHKNWTVHPNQYVNTGSIIWTAGSFPTHSVIDNPKDRLYSLGMMTAQAGAVSDASFPDAPPDMTMAYDTTNNKLYVRTGGAWKSVALT
jgi:hypothetical protein